MTSAAPRRAVTRARLNRNGVVLYRGPSRFDGRPIVVVATGLTEDTNNAKTGRMLQVWILDASDTIARPRASICGACVHGRVGSCYVQWAKAPAAVLACYQRGRYRDATLSDLRAIRAGVYGPVRAGAAGDPAAAPDALWRILRPATGYTHAWSVRPGLRGLVMASVDSDAGERFAHSLGWRTFRVLAPGATPATTTARTVECLSDSRGVTCADCRLCDGTRGGKRDNATVASIWIQAHGATATKFRPGAPTVNRLMLPVLR